MPLAIRADLGARKEIPHLQPKGHGGSGGTVLFKEMSARSMGTKRVTGIPTLSRSLRRRFRQVAEDQSGGHVSGPTIQSKRLRWMQQGYELGLFVSHN